MMDSTEGADPPRIRVRPVDLVFTKEKPFEGDLLGRGDHVRSLASLIKGIGGPCVIGLDAPWGTGKTTFLAMLRAHLEATRHPVVFFNAWETDFVAEPFVALSSELTEGLSQVAGASAWSEQLEATKSAAADLLRTAVPALIRIATAGALDLSPLLEKEAGDLLANYAEARLADYRGAKDSIESFRDRLARLAQSVREEEGTTGPLTIVIDELDRCRPSYAIELLETAKHLFSVDDVVFVLALDRGELAHSITALYGSGFDGVGYLRRFFDVDSRLAEPDRTQFLSALLNQTRVVPYLEEAQDVEVRKWGRLLARLIQVFLLSLGQSPRQDAQSVHRLGLILASRPLDDQSRISGVVTLFLLRVWRLDLFRAFTSGEIGVHEVAHTFALDRRLHAFFDRPEGHLFEAALISLQVGRDGQRGSKTWENLISAYGERASKEKPENSQQTRTGEILRLLDELYDHSSQAYEAAVHRVELASAYLNTE